MHLLFHVDEMCLCCRNRMYNISMVTLKHDQERVSAIQTPYSATVDQAAHVALCHAAVLSHVQKT